MTSFWNRYLDEHLKVFAKLLSLVKLSSEQIDRVVNALILLGNFGEQLLSDCIPDILTVVKKHYDSKINRYTSLLQILINSKIIGRATSSPSAYPNLVKELTESSNNDIYEKCCDTIEMSASEREKCILTYIFHPILLKYDELKWKSWIMEHIQDSDANAIFKYLQDRVIPFNSDVKQYYIEKLKLFSKPEAPGVHSSPDYKSIVINNLLVLVLIDCICDIEDIAFLEQYADENDYLDFFFHSETFDYSKINTADYMWCNFINNSKFRERIIAHKGDFWNKENEKRISLGFGSEFENRVTYKYLFE